MADGTDMQDIISFLRNSRPEVRQMAVDLIKGLTGDPAGLVQLTHYSKQLLPELLRLVSDQEKIQQSAITALVNLCQDPAVMQQLLELNVVARVADYLISGASGYDDLLLMLLANVTTIEKGSQQLLQLGQGVREGFNMAVLLKLFMAKPNPDEPDKYQHIAAILTNVTRLKPGRAMLLEPGRGLLTVLVAQAQSDNLVRRQGCAAAFRNCCFSAEQDGTLSDILTCRPELEQVLDQLCGIGRNKEPDDAVRGALAEATLMLAETTEGRAALWKLKAPEQLKKGYEDEEDVDVCEAMERIAELFLSDSGSVEEVVEDSNSHKQ